MARNSNTLLYFAEGDDYLLANGTTFIFTINDSSICLNIIILDDFLLEGDEVFNLILYTSDDIILVIPAITTIIIIDDEEKRKFCIPFKVVIF